MRTRMKIYSCLLAFVLGCNVTAEIQQKIIREKASISLRCPHSVEGKVTWSREINGNKVDIITADPDGDIRHNDPGRRYSSLADKSLHISRAAVSDTGRYFCNNELAMELTVIPSGHKVPPTMTTTPKTTTTTPPPPPTTRRTTPPPLPAPSTPLVNTAAPYLWQTSVHAVIVILSLIIMISITVITWRKARQKQKRHTTETENDL
ncbi:uncharacterized protein LOC122864813 [Siniperca chuatsi]|uniref:uncharacterized protein LOC122864813 n=1 Tax=Siniperca chuatsi TaxID=119488 RepID=UPI001CE0F81B|nr:uncharacterized protein LOC122864813 [Siniperca chuatsi]